MVSKMMIPVLTQSGEERIRPEEGETANNIEGGVLKTTEKKGSREKNELNIREGGSDLNACSSPLNSR